MAVEIFRRSRLPLLLANMTQMQQESLGENCGIRMRVISLLDSGPLGTTVDLNQEHLSEFPQLSRRLG